MISWAESAIEGACTRAEAWYRKLPEFEPRPEAGKGAVVGFKHPAILSERDCVVAFARFLQEEGVPSDATHHELSVSRWMFDEPHPAATAMAASQRRRRLDLTLVTTEELQAAALPARKKGFQLDAVLEFGYLSDYWKVPGASRFGAPAKGRQKVMEDVEKIGSHLQTGACRVGYVVVFEECDWEFSPTFVAEAAEVHHGCRARFIRGYESA